MKQISIRLLAVLLAVLILLPQNPLLLAEEGYVEDPTTAVSQEEVPEESAPEEEQTPEEPQDPPADPQSEQEEEPVDPEEPETPPEEDPPEEPVVAPEPLAAPEDFTVETLAEEQRFLLKWTPVSGASGYEIEYAVTEDFLESKTISIEDSAVDQYDELLFFLLDPGVTYYVRIRTLSEEAGPGPWSTAAEMRIEEEALEIPEIINAVNHKDKAVRVYWTDTGAEQYELKLWPDGDPDAAQTFTVEGTVEKAVTGLAAGTTYVLSVRSLEGDKQSEWSAPVTCTIDFFKPTLSSVANNSGAALNVAWQAVPGAEGFELQYATSSKYKNAQILTVSGSDKVSGKIPSLEADTTYYVRMRAYKTVDGAKVYTGWTKSKKAKVTFYTPTFKSLENKAWRSMTATWTAVTSAEGYQVQYSTSSKMSSAKTVTVKGGTKITKKISKLVKNKTYYVRIRAYKTVDGKKVYSSWTAKKKVKLKLNLDYKKLNVPCRMQYPSLPNGCEAVALTNVLLYYGYDLSTTYLADKIIPRSSSNFVTKYWGDPHSDSGNSIAAPGLAMAANKYLKKKSSKYQAYNMTGTKFSALLDQVELGRPVIIWTTMYQAKLGRQYSTTQYYDGVAYKVYTNSHTVVLNGFDRKKGIVYLSDSISGKVSYDLKWIQSLYEARGSQAVVIY